MTNPIPEELISAYLDDQLSPSERQRFETLLVENAELRRVLEDLMAIRSDLQGLPRASLDSGFSDRVLEAIRSRNAPRGELEKEGSQGSPLVSPAKLQKQNDHAPAWQWLAAGAAALLLAVALSVNWSPDPLQIGMNKLPKAPSKPAAKLEVAPLNSDAIVQDGAIENRGPSSGAFSVPQNSLAAPAPPDSPMSASLPAPLASAPPADADLRKSGAEGDLARISIGRAAAPGIQEKGISQLEPSEQFDSPQADGLHAAKRFGDLQEHLKNASDEEASREEIVIRVSVADELRGERFIREMLASHEPRVNRNAAQDAGSSQDRAANHQAKSNALPERSQNQLALADLPRDERNLKEFVLETSPESLSRFLAQASDEVDQLRVVDSDIVERIRQVPPTHDQLAGIPAEVRSLADAAPAPELAATAKASAKSLMRRSAPGASAAKAEAKGRGEGGGVEGVVPEGAAAMAAAPAAGDEQQLAPEDKQTEATDKSAQRSVAKKSFDSTSAEGGGAGFRQAQAMKPGEPNMSGEADAVTAERQLITRKVRVRIIFVPVTPERKDVPAKPAETPATPELPAAPE